MPCNLKVGEQFPDFTLKDHQGRMFQLSPLTKAPEYDRRLGFDDGYPAIVVFYRGFFCPRDQQQMRMLTEFQKELKVNFCKLIVVGVDKPQVQAAFRAGLGADWKFISDPDRTLIKEIDILDETEGEYAYRALPYTFVLNPDLSVHKIYNGWYFVGRPTLNELRVDLRAIMEKQSYYSYEAFNTDHATRLRIPQQNWANGAPMLGQSGLEVREGVVAEFNFNSGNGFITSQDDRIFFNFTAIPGEGYRTITPGTNVKFELVETKTGLSARNVQAQD